jgi:hypothetical protein
MTLINSYKGSKYTARITGIWYLLMAITGILGFMVFHSQVYVSGDAQQTLTNLTENQGLARTRLLLEFGIVISQALTAIYFYKLFRSYSASLSWSLGALGFVNAIAIMLSAIAMASCIGLANADSIAVDDKVLMIAMLQQIISNAWGVGAIFFGLWLFPMGYVVVKYKIMPTWLGRMILIGGVGYLASTFLKYAGIDFSFRSYLTLPATIGEFWMIGYLLIFGIREEMP